MDVDRSLQNVPSVWKDPVDQLLACPYATRRRGQHGQQVKFRRGHFDHRAVHAHLAPQSVDPKRPADQRRVWREFGLRTALLSMILVATDISGFDWIGTGFLRYAWLALIVLTPAGIYVGCRIRNGDRQTLD